MASQTMYRQDGWVKNALGVAIGGASIYVISPQPANIIPQTRRSDGTLSPFVAPTPQCQVYSDALGVKPITQPILTDGFGHYDFYSLPGIATVVVCFQGKVQQVYPDQSFGAVGTIVPFVLPPFPPSPGAVPNFQVRVQGATLSVENQLNLLGVDGSIVITDLQSTNGAVSFSAKAAIAAAIAAAGVSVPAGGTAGQVLTKNSAINFDSSWQTPASGSSVSLRTNTVPNSSQGILDVQDTATVAWTSTPGGVLQASVVAGGGSGVQSAVTTLTAFQMQHSHTTPIQLVPAPGAGKMNVLIKIVVEYIAASVDFGGVGTWQTYMGSDIAAAGWVAYPMLSSAFTNDLVSKIAMGDSYESGGSMQFVARANWENQAIMFDNSVDQSAGDGSMRITTYYLVQSVL